MSKERIEPSPTLPTTRTVGILGPARRAAGPPVRRRPRPCPALSRPEVTPRSRRQDGHRGVARPDRTMRHPFQDSPGEGVVEAERFEMDIADMAVAGGERAAARAERGPERPVVEVAEDLGNEVAAPDGP